MKTILTQDEYLKLVALFALAKEHMKRVKDCEYALTRILTLAPNHERQAGIAGDHISDEIFGRECDAQDFIRRYGLEVEDK